MNHKAFFVSGIDTDAGKTYCTAWLAKQWMNEGLSVVTQKFIQTGCDEYSEDIEAHRRLCGIDPLPEDLDHTTAPLIYHHPCSPQLAARLDGRDIPLDIIDRSTETLLKKYDRVLVEGAGGLMVPITDEMFTIDYVSQRHLPLIMVVHGALGSINHIILSLEAIKKRGIERIGLLYNTIFDTDPLIAADTRAFVERYLKREFPDTQILDVPSLMK